MVAKKVDGNSSVNQSIKTKFVEREVLTCASYLMQELFNQGVAHYEDIENGGNYKCPNCGDMMDLEDFKVNKKGEYKCPTCKALSDEEPEYEYHEIYEWWIVTDWLFDLLKEEGQPVMEFFNLSLWGRCTTGQSILLDGVMTRICSKLEILEGQANEWKV